ncbi:glutamate [NMDA] receptor subunit 1-like isoform X2 [Mya arenaria]|uniref:glutamate [NMDA] receptor subunit 1-like isoform X2 n=1 Tax=Mya arenaria TaxID=6604 RepID=UPI0022DF98FE|nr:glutamate [NMDA] receptor subunit 1-like isoform X2 [Mya arenaria]
METTILARMCWKILILLSLTTALKAENIHIGAVVSSPENVDVLRNYVYKANSRLDVKSVGLTFNATAQLMDANPIRSALSVCDDIISKRVHVIIVSHPPGSDQSPISVSYTCGYYGIPLIGIYARDSAFTDKNVHPTFMRTVPPYFQQASVWIDLLQHFGWRQVIFIHGMDEEGRAILSRFQALAEQEEIKIEKTIKFSVGISNFSELLEDLHSAQSRIILFSAGREDAQVLFQNAAEMKLTTGSDFVWIVSEEAMRADNVPIGAVGLELINGSNESANLEDSVRLVVDTAVDLFSVGNLTTITNTPDSCSTPMTDKWQDGMLFLKQMKRMTVEGQTGRLQFTEEGDRLNPIYYIKNKQPGVIEKVGFHGRRGAEGQNLNFAKDQPIVWPSGSTDKPDGLKISTHLEVVTIEAKPFVYKWPIYTASDELKCAQEKGVNCTFSNETTGEVSHHCCFGYCIDMLNMLSEKVKFTFKLHLSADNAFGSFKRVGNSTRKEWTGMVGELVREEGVTSDLVVAPLTINPERAAVIDFSKPFKYQGLTILVKKEQKDSSLASFLQPFTNTLWILVALSVHVVALVLYLLDRFSPFGRFKLAKNDDTEEDALNMSSAMWFAWGVLLNSGIGEGTPRSFSARVLGMVWAGFAMIIVASYTANLAAFLVLDRPDASISGIDDSRLRNPNENFRYATVKDSAVEMYFKRQVELSTMYRKMEKFNYKNADDAIKDVKKGVELQAFIWDSSRLEYEDAKDCDLVVAGELFGRSGLGVGLRKGSPWTHLISLAILELHEGGQMEKLDNKWILIESTECPERDHTPATLGLTNMAGVFMMVAGGIVAGVFLIFVEILYKRHRGLKEKELELARNAADRWRGNIAKKKQLRESWSFLRALKGSQPSSSTP